MNRKIIEKLRKLINHAKSAKEIGNTSEAEAFGVRIQKLLDAHNLSLDDIEIEELKSTVNKSETQTSAVFNWQKSFIVQIATLNGCETVFCRNKISLIGTEIDRILTLEIYAYFEKLGRDFADTELKHWHSTVEYRRKRKKQFHSKLYKTSFLTGFTMRLISRFKQQNAEAKAASNNETALIFIGNKLADANQWMLKNLKIRISKVKAKPIKFKEDTFMNGVSAADSVALTHKTME